MKPTRFLICIFALFLMGALPSIGQRRTSLNFENSPIDHLMEFYASFSGMTVTIHKASYSNITLKSDRPLTDSEVDAAILSYLTSNGVVISRAQGGYTVSPVDTNPNQHESTIYTPHNNELPAHEIGVTREQFGQNMTDDEMRIYLTEYRIKLKENGLPQPELTPNEIRLGVIKQ